MQDSSEQLRNTFHGVWDTLDQFNILTGSSKYFSKASEHQIEFSISLVESNLFLIRPRYFHGNSDTSCDFRYQKLVRFPFYLSHDTSRTLQDSCHVVGYIHYVVG